MQVTIEADTKEIKKKLDTIQDKVDNLEPLLREMANFLVNTTEESFEEEKTPDGKSWSPIKNPDSKKHSKMLWKDGILQGSLNSKVDKNGLSVGVNAKKNNFLYPIIHQFGSKNVNARPFMPIHQNGELYKETENKLIEMVEEYMEQVLK